HYLDEPALEELLDHLLVVREQSGMVLSEPSPQQAGVDHASEQSLLVAVLEFRESLRGDTIDGLLLFRGGQVELVVRAPLQRLAASASREYKVDRRQHVHVLQLVDHVEQVVGRQVAVATDAI